MAETSSSNLDPKVAKALCYAPFIGGLVSLVLLLIEKNTDIKWHAAQGVILALVSLVASFVPVLGWLVALGIFVLTIVLTYKTYQGQTVRLPVIGDLADKLVKKA